MTPLPGQVEFDLLSDVFQADPALRSPASKVRLLW